MVTATSIALPSSSSWRKVRGGVPPRREPVEHAAHGLRGVVLHVAHVGGDHRQAELGGHALELGRSAGVGGHLSAQVGEVLLQVAHRVRRPR